MLLASPDSGVKASDDTSGYKELKQTIAVWVHLLSAAVMFSIIDISGFQVIWRALGQRPEVTNISTQFFFMGECFSDKSPD